MSGRLKRLNLIDSIRGITIISMIGFHACWILWYFGILISSDLLFGDAFFVWERTICCTFIFISGYSFTLGHHHFRRGVIILFLGIAITILSLKFAYDVRDIFGILWFLGLAQLFQIVYDRLFGNDNKIIAFIGMILSLAVFVAVWDINRGNIGIANLFRYDMPKSLYNGYFMTLIGFQDPNFYSVDYFSFIPWIFLYITGYYCGILFKKTKFESKILVKKIPVLSWMGRHSLEIYIIHPIVLFVVIYLIKNYLL